MEMPHRRNAGQAGRDRAVDTRLQGIGAPDRVAASADGGSGGRRRRPCGGRWLRGSGRGAPGSAEVLVPLRPWVAPLWQRRPPRAGPPRDRPRPESLVPRLRAPAPAAGGPAPTRLRRARRNGRGRPLAALETVCRARHPHSIFPTLHAHASLANALPVVAGRGHMQTIGGRDWLCARWQPCLVCSTARQRGVPTGDGAHLCRRRTLPVLRAVGRAQPRGAGPRPSRRSEMVTRRVPSWWRPRHDREASPSMGSDRRAADAARVSPTLHRGMAAPG